MSERTPDPRTQQERDAVISAIDEHTDHWCLDNGKGVRWKVSVAECPTTKHPLADLEARAKALGRVGGMQEARDIAFVSDVMTGDAIGEMDAAIAEAQAALAATRGTP